MKMKKIFSMVLLGAMMAGFTVCEGEEPTNGSNTDGTGKGSYKAMVIDSELLNATAVLSATSGIAFDDEVTLTVTPDGDWESEPTVKSVNVTQKGSAEQNGIYTFVFTGFTGDAVFTVAGVSTAGSNGSGGGDNGGSNNGSTSGSENGHEYVDLGLPSGLLWATCNVGATSPEEYGNYFAWGEVTTKESYSWDTYKYGTYNYDGDYSKLTKYNPTDSKTVLDPEDDAAAVIWGGDWRMPTYEEQTELRNNCTWTWTSKNVVNGYEIEGPNGNSIFLPAAGCRFTSSLYDDGSRGYYWCSLLHTNTPYYACSVYFGSDNFDWGNFNRFYGQSVRAVCSAK